MKRVACSDQTSPTSFPSSFSWRSFADAFTGIALRRSGILFLFLWGVLGPPEARLIHTLSKFHCRIHELCPTNHHSSSWLQIFPSITDTFTGIALRRSGILFQFIWGVLGPPEAQLIHTLSKFPRLFHELCPTNHHSSPEPGIYRTSCLLLAFLNLTTCHLSNLKSINLISSPFPLSLSLSSFFLLPLLGLCLGHHGFSPT